MSDTGHMHADLMCTSGLQLTLDISIIAETFQYFIMRYCMPALLCMRTHFFPVNGMSADRSIYGAFVFFYIAVYNCNINPVD